MFVHHEPAIFKNYVYAHIAQPLEQTTRKTSYRKDDRAMRPRWVP